MIQLRALSFLLNPKALIGMVAAAAVSVLSYKAITFYREAHANELHLQTVIAELADAQEQVTLLAQMAETQKRALEIAERAREQAEVVRSQSQQLIEQLNERGPEDDGPVAPVLRDTLDAIGRLRRTQ